MNATASLLVAAMLPLVAWGAPKKNGFDLENATVPAREIVRGGPPRDGIPALTNPSFVDPTEAKLADDDRVLGVHIGGVAKAFPIRMLNVHEIVNDSVGAQHYAVTFCPLCGSGVVFATNIGDAHLNFGVSGLLYKSDLLLYDRNTESLWSQLTAAAVSGKLVGTKLPTLPVVHTTWLAWREDHPDGVVMRGLTEFLSAYRNDPYPGYERSRQIYFPVGERAPRTYHPKERVLGVVVAGIERAYPFSELEKLGRAEFTDAFGDSEVTIRWDASNNSATAALGATPLAATTLYWFAWYAFHPETEVFTAPSVE